MEMVFDIRESDPTNTPSLSLGVISPDDIIGPIDRREILGFLLLCPGVFSVVISDRKPA